MTIRRPDDAAARLPEVGWGSIGDATHLSKVGWGDIRDAPRLSKRAEHIEMRIPTRSDPIKLRKKDPTPVR